MRRCGKRIPRTVVNLNLPHISCQKHHAAARHQERRYMNEAKEALADVEPSS